MVRVLQATALLVLSAVAVQGAWPFKASAVSAPSPAQSLAAPPVPAAASMPTGVPSFNPDDYDDDEFFDFHAKPVPLKASPTAAPAPTPFTGTEYHYLNLVFRPALFVKEACLLVALVLYYFTTTRLAKRNVATADEWFVTNAPHLREQFASVGMGGGVVYARDGTDEFISSATGRRGVEALTIMLRTDPADLLVSLYYLARGLSQIGWESGADQVVLDFKLRAPVGTPGSQFVFAVCDRGVLKSLRDSRWDLLECTNVTEQAALPESLIAMGESPDITNALVKERDYGLLDALKSTAALEDFVSLVITDLPAEKPEIDKPTLPVDEYHCILTLRLPHKATNVVSPVLVSLFRVLDVIHVRPALFSPLALNKLKSKRTTLQASLKAPGEQEKRDELKKKRDAEDKKRYKEDKKALEKKLKAMPKAERTRYIAAEEAREKQEIADGKIVRKR